MTEHKHLQSYLMNLPSQYMYAILKFKCANHRMPIVSGRHNGIPIDERKCNLCDLNDHFNKIGDEFHYLFTGFHKMCELASGARREVWGAAESI